MRASILRHFFIATVCLSGMFFSQTGAAFSIKDVPEPAQCYFNAVAKSDLEALAQCFQPDAVIIDVSRKISGIEAIRTWADNEVMGGRYEVLSSVSQTPDRIKLLIRFVPPGYGSSASGFKAHYTFDFKDGKIVRMDLQYA